MVVTVYLLILIMYHQGTVDSFSVPGIASLQECEKLYVSVKNAKKKSLPSHHAALIEHYHSYECIEYKSIR